MKKRQLTIKGYQNYVNAYTKKVKVLRKKGLLPASGKLSRQAWEETYKATRNTLLQEVREGTRKQIGNVNQYIISNQIYEVSAKQARVIKKAAEMTGQKLSISAIRSGEFDWTQIKEEYIRGKALGLTGKESSMLISWFYFGSE